MSELSVYSKILLKAWKIRYTVYTEYIYIYIYAYKDIRVYNMGFQAFNPVFKLSERLKLNLSQNKNLFCKQKLKFKAKLNRVWA